MKKPTKHLIAEVPRRHAQTELTVGIDLGDVWSHYCTLNQHGEVVDRGRFRTTAKAIDKWFTYIPHARVAMEAGTHSIWISEQLEQLGHEVIVANVRELRAISHSDRKSDQVDAEKLARYARLDPEILRPVSHRTVEQQEGQRLDRALISSLERDPLLSERLRRLKTIPGVGAITALTWALEIGDYTRFPSVKQAISYCGLCGAEKSSADKVMRTPISKQRNKHIQHVLVEAAKLAPRYSHELALLRDKEIQRGNKNRATLAVARKLVAYMLAVDRRQQDFVPAEELTAKAVA